MIFEMAVFEEGSDKAVWRKYTTSEAKANSFRKIPKIAEIKGYIFEFRINDHEGKKLPKLVPYVINVISNWIMNHA